MDGLLRMKSSAVESCCHQSGRRSGLLRMKSSASESCCAQSGRRSGLLRILAGPSVALQSAGTCASGMDGLLRMKSSAVESCCHQSGRRSGLLRMNAGLASLSSSQSARTWGTGAGMSEATMNPASLVSSEVFVGTQGSTGTSSSPSEMSTSTTPCSSRGRTTPFRRTPVTIVSGTGGHCEPPGTRPAAISSTTPFSSSVKSLCESPMPSTASTFPATMPERTGARSRESESSPKTKRTTDPDAETEAAGATASRPSLPSRPSAPSLPSRPRA